MTKETKPHEVPVDYDHAIQQLESVILEIEGGEVSMDELIKKVEYATKLLSYCKERIVATEAIVEELVETLNED